MYAGLKEVSREAIDEVGVCLDRIFDLVDRKRRLIRCGTYIGRLGREKGMRGMVKEKRVWPSPLSEKYCALMMEVSSMWSWQYGQSSSW